MKNHWLTSWTWIDIEIERKFETLKLEIELIWNEGSWREKKKKEERERERERESLWEDLGLFGGTCTTVYGCVNFFGLSGFLRWNYGNGLWRERQIECVFACVLLVKSRGSSGIVVKFFFFLNEFDRLWTFASTLWLVVYC